MPFINIKNNVKIFYNVVGSGEDTIVLIHGAGATCRMWSLQLRELVKAGYRVIVYDCRGHGATAATDGLYSIDLFADDLKELLEALNVKEKVYLCGLSMGGLIAQSFVINNPEKVKALVLSNTYSFLGYEYLSTALGVDVETLKNTDITNKYIYNIFSKQNNEGWNFTDNMLQASEMLGKQDIEKNLFFDDQVYIQSYKERIKTQSATGSFDSRNKLEQIKCPTLVIGGENDIVIPIKYSIYLHEHINESKFIIMRGSNHIPSLDNYVKFNEEIINFFRCNK